MVAVSGRLQAADLRRLEQACGPALTTHPLRIELQLAKVTEMDAAAGAFLDLMTSRGAVLASSRIGAHRRRRL
jgi:hypothetical protein